MNWRNKIKKIVLGFGVLLLLLIMFIFFCNRMVENSAEGKTFSSLKTIPYNRVGVVLGTSKYQVEGGINLYFEYRVEAIVALYNSKKIDFILVSGDNSSMFYNEPQAFKNTLMKHGIPAEKIYLDYAGFRTLDSMIRAHKVFGLTHFTVISQQFQNERAIYLANQHNIDVVGFNAKNVSSSYGLKTQLREYLARCKAVIDVVLNVKPKYLGKPVEIE